MSNNRRDFFKTLGTAAAGVAAINPLINPGEASAAVSASKQIAFTHGLALGGSFVGIVRDFDGGDAVGTIVKEQVDVFGVVRKHLGNVKYEDIKFACGADMTTEFYGWLAKFVSREPQYQSGAILAADAAGNTKSQLTFPYALITKIGFPELDAASKEAAKFNLTLAPETTKVDPPTITSIRSAVGTKAKPWLTNNFRVSIGNIPAETTSRVTKVDAFSIKQNIVEAEPGEIRDYEKVVDPLDIDNITLNIPERFAQPFIDWHHQFVVLGNNGSESETFLKIEYLDNRGTTLFTLMFYGVGIYRASPLGETDKHANLRLVQVGLYAEVAEFFVGTQVPA